MALSKRKLQQLKEVCQDEDIDYSGLRRKQDLMERINEVRKVRQTAVEDDDGEDEVEFNEDVANVASQSVSQNGGSSCSRGESTVILRLRLQLELASAEKKRFQAEREMMREEWNLGFRAKR